jgi:hypothetical protein
MAMAMAAARKATSSATARSAASRFVQTRPRSSSVGEEEKVKPPSSPFLLPPPAGCLDPPFWRWFYCEILMPGIYQPAALSGPVLYCHPRLFFFELPQLVSFISVFGYKKRGSPPCVWSNLAMSQLARLPPCVNLGGCNLLSEIVRKFPHWYACTCYFYCFIFSAFATSNRTR